NRLKIGIKAILFAQRQVVDFAAVVLRVRAGDGVAGDGHERNVAGVNEAGRQHGQGGLGADGVIDLRLRIEGNAKDLLHEAGGRLFEGSDTIVGIAPVFQLVDLALADFTDQGIGHVVVFADAKVEQGPLGMGGQYSPLGAFDLLELVNLRALA